jgi:hypothetical protein
MQSALDALADSTDVPQPAITTPRRSEADRQQLPVPPNGNSHSRLHPTPELTVNFGLGLAALATPDAVASPSAPITGDASPTHPMQQSSQGAGGPDASYAVAGTISVGPPSARPITENIASNFIDDVIGEPVAAQSQVGGIRSAGPPVGTAPPAIAHAIFARPASPSAGNASTVAPPDTALASSAADSFDLSSRDLFAFDVSFVSAIDSAADPLPRVSPAAQLAVSGVDVAQAPGGLAPRSEATPRSTISGGQLVDAPSVLAGSGSSAALPVAGSSDSTPPDALPTSLTEPLSHHVIGLAVSGGQEIVLRLHPPELGDLTVRVVANGREISAWFGSPQMPVQQAVSQAIGQLQIDLGNAGYNLAGAWVGAEAWSSRERDGTPASPQPQRGAVTRASVKQSLGSTTVSAVSGVSIYV